MASEFYDEGEGAHPRINSATFYFIDKDVPDGQLVAETDYFRETEGKVEQTMKAGHDGGVRAVNIEIKANDEMGGKMREWVPRNGRRM